MELDPGDRFIRANAFWRAGAAQRVTRQIHGSRFRPAKPNEDQGEVWFGALAWSGSWRFTVEQDQLDAIRVTGGFNPFDFGYVLHPGQSLETPVFYGGYSNQGLGGASRLLHHFEIDNVLPHRPGQENPPKPRPVIYNSWEATEFRVDEAGQTALAEKAAALGIDRFVMDDGWFGQRKDDHAGLGDWYVNQQKFPHGLKPLIDKVHSLGMDFGLWVEPEMVNPDSDLYRKHPEWVLNFPGRPRSEQRNQLVLNLARPDVRDYVLGFLDKLVTENDIAFLKWDYNRNWSEPGWDQLARRGTEAGLRRFHPQPVQHSCRPGQTASEAGNRIVLRRRRTRRSRHSALHRRSVALGQYRSLRSPHATGRIHLCLHAAGDDGVGDGLAA